MLGFDENIYMFYEDVDLCYNVKKAGFTVSDTKIQNGVNNLSNSISSQSGGVILGNSIRALQLAKENGYTVSSSTLSNVITALESEQQSDGSWYNNGYIHRILWGFYPCNYWYLFANP